MMIHFSLGGMGAIHGECTWAYGLKPAWKISRVGREYVLDIPFGRVILTPCRAKEAVPEIEQPCFYDRVGRTGWQNDEATKRLKHTD